MKKFVFAIVFFMSLIIYIPNTYAANIDVENISCKNKNDGGIIQSFNATINNEIIEIDDAHFSTIGDSIECTMTLKNNTSKSLEANINELNNLSNNYINYSLIPEKNNIIGPNNESIYTLKIEYNKAYGEVQELDNTFEINFNEFKNPNTGLQMMPYYILLISVPLLSLALYKANKKSRFLKISIWSFFLLSIGLIVPAVYADFETSLTIKNKIIITEANVSITQDKIELDESGSYTTTINYKDTSNISGSPKYIRTHFANKVGVTSNEWLNSQNIDLNNSTITFSDDTLDAGIYYFHLLTTYNDGTIVESVSDKVHVTVNETIRTNDLIKLGKSLDETSPKTVSSDNIKFDYVQPWIYSGQPITRIEKDMMLLKRAGYTGVVLQYTAEVTSDDNNNIYPKSLFYDSNLYSDSVEGDVLGDMLIAANELDMDIYIGGVYSYDWWNNDKMKNTTWNSNYADFTNIIMDELQGLYGNNSHFKGWYWTNEMYTTGDGSEEYWIPHLKKVIDHLNNMDNRKPIVISPFISSYAIVDNDIVKQEWEKIINSIDLRSGDTIAFQDGFGNAEYPVTEILEFLTTIKNIIKNKNEGINFNLNLENFLGTSSISGTSSVERFMAQKNVASYLADSYFSFSYIHYYSQYEIDLNTGLRRSNYYDKKYRSLCGQDTTKDVDLISIPAPTGGYVYVDSDGLDAPIPKGFTVSSDESENTISKGLVISDSLGNEYVWIPVFYGIQDNGYKYKKYQAFGAAYARYLNNGLGELSISNVVEDSLPSGVSSEFSQINKYRGFYVGRYESSFLYANNTQNIAIKKVEDSNADTGFYPTYANSTYYNGKIMLNVNYDESKKFAESMAINNSYDSTIKTGMINGREWDTATKWIEVSNWSLYMSYDGRPWGNYLDSTDKAATGNYSKGVLKGTGSNDNWKARNIYDFAGNLREWTSEITPDSNKIIRTVAYDGDGASHGGLNGGPSYNLITPSYRFPDLGFRVVLYIE
ncbi:MAG TPA: DUF4434 domain-containing protein [Bacilli bacterium]|nr:DUF4434 domain-containing protein [Bacilli bacterium]HPZ23596.1 DUF4434 domain-containing protein [Bacilli bacterium]HQC83918.1 DUF4434 domain-containing protein [Bacilli bacterium]